MIAQSILPEFEREFATLRSILERVPEDKPDYKPHEKSMPLAKLAGHLAEIPAWMEVSVNHDELDFSKGDYTPYVMTTRKDLLEKFDANVAQAKSVLAGASDQTMMSNWSMKTGDQVHMTMPKVAVVRGFVMNHMIHHRAQLGVYLRLNDIALPSTYGPTADESPMG
ncbi:MAG: DinB family protein [Candidatus Eisenbacteria bacterium]|uniref:DinB family protein n=1 Tax=Eiseniibacteriota bacterium TaxID=2212470 RepID=A0A956LUS9_UNCEI|nr:DinB family protein [Candidatus Eisenbacteria bacterium]